MARAALAAGLGITLAAAVAPPTPAPPAEESIVVTGTPLTREEIRRRAVEFVRGTGVASGNTPAARWSDPVCPRALGLTADQAYVVEARMRAIADAAGIKAARAPCESNIAVSFTPDAAAVVREVERRSPRRLAEVPPERRVALRDGAAPIRWWYSTETRGRHGQSGRGNPPAWAGADKDSASEGGGSVLPSGVPSMMHYDSSQISTQANRVLISASVVVDADLVRGISLDAVAAYAAFVAFAEIRAADFAPPGSILSLFETPSAPRELTDQDLAFLKALYRLPLDRQARQHRGLLVRDVISGQSSENRSN